MVSGMTIVSKGGLEAHPTVIAHYLRRNGHSEDVCLNSVPIDNRATKFAPGGSIEARRKKAQARSPQSSTAFSDRDVISLTCTVCTLVAASSAMCSGVRARVSFKLKWAPRSDAAFPSWPDPRSTRIMHAHDGL